MSVSASLDSPLGPWHPIGEWKLAAAGGSNTFELEAPTWALPYGAELIANDKPFLVVFQGEIHSPILRFYPETAFGGTRVMDLLAGDPLPRIC